MDIKFSTAIHSLIMISESKSKISSEEIAKSVGSNSSYIRKVLGLLKKNGIITSKQGISGFSLASSPDEISLLDIYKAVNQNPFFDIHTNSNDKCIVGKYIEPTLNTILEDLEDSIFNELSQKKLSDCIEIMKSYLTEEEAENINKTK